ncbi:MAG: hypothetical protein LE168_04785 [Endomicrobium sp.]|nr:hypothetical protein [Endomicrobium sp.]
MPSQLAQFSYKVVLANNQIVSICVGVKFYRDKKDIVVECPSLNLVTFGKSLEHAKEMLKESFGL